MHLDDYPHRRLNPLTGEEVLCSPHRTKRPWQGQVEKPSMDSLPEHDPACYLCPGNERSGGIRNPDYKDTFTFVNDFSALLADSPHESMDEKGLLVARTETGRCEVICFSPRHDLTISRMDTPMIEKVVELWKERYIEIGRDPSINYVQIFENRGSVMGCSNPHPHGQIWASSGLPTIPAAETERQAAWLKEKGSCLLCDYLALELSRGERVVAEGEHFAALVPFWAVWPYEIMVLPRRHMASVAELSRDESRDLAALMKRVSTRYDNLFLTSFPYSMGLHQAPTDGKAHPGWHFHMHYLPPLLRSATVKKFMVGFELLGMPQRDITAEDAAATLRGLSELHYRERA